MNYALQVVTPATEQPVSVAAACAYLRCDEVTEREAVIDLLAQACAEVERYTGRVVQPTVFRLVQMDWPRGATEFASYPRNTQGAYVRALELPKAPVTAVGSVKYYPYGSDTLTTLDPSKYLVIASYEPSMVFLRDGETWPELALRPDAVQVEFTAGIPTDVHSSALKQAILLLCRFYFAGGSPNEPAGMMHDLDKARQLLDSHRITGWTA